MPDPDRPTGVDYFTGDDRFASGTEVAGAPPRVDWLTHADKGVRFAFVKARHAQFFGGAAGHSAFFNLNYPLMKDAGLLRAPYHWLDPCEVQVPANIDAVTSSNWTNAALFPITTGDTRDFALQQANDFCDQILAQGWGEPGDLPPAVDIEPSVFLTATGNVAKAVILDGQGHPILEDAAGNQIGFIDIASGQNLLNIQGGENVLGAQNNILGRVRLNNNGHPDAIIDAAGNVLRCRLRKDYFWLKTCQRNAFGGVRGTNSHAEWPHADSAVTVDCVFGAPSAG